MSDPGANLGGGLGGGSRPAAPADRVLELLYDRREGHFSRPELAAAAGLDAEAVTRALDQLRREGFSVECSPAHGLRLVRPVPLYARLIERGLGTRRVGRSVICFKEVGSTNDVAFEAGRRADSDGLAVLAEWQRQGRGRQGRRWLSAPGANILLSVLLMESGGDPAGRLPHEALTIATGLAVAEAVEVACGLRCGLKWPNDVLIDQAKAAGVLVELRRQRSRCCAVLGVGVNVNAAPGAAEVAGAVTCIAEHHAGPVERVDLARELLRRLDASVVCIEQGRLDELHEHWLAHSQMLNQRLTVLCAGTSYTGRVLDVSPLEGMVLSCDDGRRLHLPAAQSTIVDPADEPETGW